jgi:hypothetical protein
VIFIAKTDQKGGMIVNAMEAAKGGPVLAALAAVICCQLQLLEVSIFYANGHHYFPFVPCIASFAVYSSTPMLSSYSHKKCMRWRQGEEGGASLSLHEHDTASFHSDIS